MNDTITNEQARQFATFRVLAQTPGLLYANDPKTYIAGTLSTMLVVNRFSKGLFIDPNMSWRWNISTALSELPGTIEGAIILSKWERNWATLNGSTKLDPIQVGLISSAIINSAFCVEKALKTLWAIILPSEDVPRGHSLQSLWQPLPSETKIEVENELSALPPSWQKPDNPSRDSTASMLNTSDNAFTWGRYLPELNPGSPRSTTEPLMLVQVAASILLVCLAQDGIARPLSSQ